MHLWDDGWISTFCFISFSPFSYMLEWSYTLMHYWVWMEVYLTTLKKEQLIQGKHPWILCFVLKVNNKYLEYFIRYNGNLNCVWSTSVNCKNIEWLPNQVKTMSHDLIHWKTMGRMQPCLGWMGWKILCYWMKSYLVCFWHILSQK